jgi:hypothetical protein
VVQPEVGEVTLAGRVRTLWPERRLRSREGCSTVSRIHHGDRQEEDSTDRLDQNTLLTKMLNYKLYNILNKIGYLY